MRNIHELIAQSRLVIHSYDSTGILETLSLNIPTLFFWNGGLDHLLPSAKPYYELLRSSDILLDTPEKAAEIVALHWDKVNEWWESKKVQDARKTFCNQYSRTVKNPVRTMKRLLTAHENGHWVDELCFDWVTTITWTDIMSQYIIFRMEVNVEKAFQCFYFARSLYGIYWTCYAYLNVI